MNSPYISIDIETTGTNEERHQVLEIGAVYNQQDVDVMSCPYFHIAMDPGEIVGTAYALNMNARIIKHLAIGKERNPTSAMMLLMNWVRHLRKQLDIEQFHLIGKNVGAFDLQFLKRIPGWQEDYFSHRHMEVGSVYSTPGGISGQSELLNTIAADAKIEGNPHEALYDARVSLELARQFWQLQPSGLLRAVLVKHHRAIKKFKETT